MRNKPAIPGSALFLLLFLLCGSRPLSAQPEFDREPSFEQIREMFAESYQGTRDQKKEALAWYHFARYDERIGSKRDSVLSYLRKSADLFLRSGDTLSYYKVRTDLADRMAGREFAREALQIQQEALTYYRQKRDTLREMHLLIRTYHILLLNGDTVEAKLLKEDFKQKNRYLRDTLLEINMLIEDVDRYQREGRLREASQLSFLILGLAERTGRSEFITQAQYNIGYFSQYVGNYATALAYLHAAERSNPRGDPEMRRQIYRQLSQIYTALDSVETARDYAWRFALVTDTLLSENRAAARARMALAIDREEKGEEIANLQEKIGVAKREKQEQRLFFGAIAVALAGIALTLIVIVIGYRHRLRTGRIIAAQTAELNEQKIRSLEAGLEIERMQSMMAGQESERQRIATDLHDSLGGLLAAAKIQLENLPSKAPGLSDSPEWHKLKDLLDDTVDEARHIARNLLPGALLRFGLVAAIQDRVSRVRGEGMPAITFQHFGDFADLPELIALNCYRVVQELLQNSLKHGRATEILVQLTRTDREIALLVEDNGRGFDPDTAPKGMGTNNVAQRVQFMRGELSMQTAPGEGTSIHVTIPLAA